MNRYNRSMSVLLGFYALLIGAIVGSFLNVVIHRYPREESIVFPPSRCPSCAAAIKPWDNIPILSFLILGGKCRACRAPISLRYPLVELANGLFYLALFQRTGLSLSFIPVAAIISMTLVLIYIDAEIQILPDVIDLPGVLIGLGIGAMQLGQKHPDLVLSESLADAAIGAVSGAGVLLIIAFVYKWLRRVDGMGYGDVKMLAMIGATSGWRSLFAVLFLASIIGAIFGIAVAIRSGRGMQVPIPFGVFLGVASLAVIFFGHTLFEWWISSYTLR
jgi:leader peptidase (prepilin peptidase) / N-methyltransferase